ncbi:MAG: tRNA 2-thiouridine(34) synthase MnmA, partial [Phycisphaerae bacterium]|nr:tRNA 2-thiouridine(34) synthase MnmA [Phycisphaerae bacterium]
EVRDARGRLLGTHAGIVNYTIGQRRGLGIAAGQPIYVTKLDAEHNTVVVGPREELMSAGLVADQVNWLTDPPADGVWQPAEIKIRSQHTPTNGRLRVNVAAGPRASRHRLEAGPTVDVRFDEPQPAVTPGQATVFYRDDGIVLGGGWIVRGMQNG